MAWLFILGFLAGALALFVPLRRARRETDRVEYHNLRLAQDRQRLIDFMHLMAEALGEGLSLEALRQRIVHASIVCTGALSACIFEKTERGTMRAAAVEGLFPPHRPLTGQGRDIHITRAKFIEQVLKAEEFPMDEGIVGRVANTRLGELLVDAAADSRIVRHADAALAVRSVIAVPLLFREEFFGVLAVTNPAGDDPFTEADFSLMRSLAEQAAVALHNAAFLHLQLEKQQLDLDLSLASGIQQMLLPREAKAVPGLEVDSRYAPAQKVGGDFYDTLPLSPTQLGVMVADVSGKGIPASLLMAMCRTHFRQIAPRHSSPAAALNEMNRILLADIRPEHYVTMIYGIVDVTKNTLTFARAGHELPLFVRIDIASGKRVTAYPTSEGMALGMAPQEIFSAVIEDRTEPFVVGDAFLLYTDGLNEAPNADGAEFSGARLAETARSLHGRTAREVNDGIMQAVKLFAGDTPPRDDLTLVTVRRI